MSGSARVRLRDVAAAAGTTPMTVSNVLNGRAGQVGAATAARVLAACERLGYRPNADAKRLRARACQAIGLVIVDPSPYYLSDPFTAALVAGLNEALGRAGYSLILQGAPALRLHDVPMLRQVESDGLCLVASGPQPQRHDILRQVARLGQPIVLVQDEAPDDLVDVCCVLQDDAAGAASIAQHLLHPQPPRHCVMLVPSVAWPAMERREAALRTVLSGRTLDFHVVRCPDEGFGATQSALADHIAAHGVPDTLIGGNDRMALAALRLLAGRGLRVPHDVRVTGFNGFDFAHYADPPLTTVISPAFALGETAAAALLARLATGRFGERRRCLPVVFAPNASSVTPPGGAVTETGNSPAARIRVASRQGRLTARRLR
jgi:LacI family transcriptional regulator